MDRNTSLKIERISRSIPSDWKKRLISSSVDLDDEDMAKDIIKHKRVSQDKLDKLQKAVDEGLLRHSSRETDKRITEKISAYVDGKMRAEIASGRLKPAKRDAFMRRQEERMKRI